MIKRANHTLFLEYLKIFPVVAIIGPRQSGKTTLTHELPSEAWIFFDLEKGADFDMISRDPDLFLRLNPKQVVIDEAQILPDLFPALRVAVDADRSSKGRYVITGSSSPELLGSISESLAGRIGIIELSPLTLSEIFGPEDPTNSFFNIFTGSAPEDVFSKLKARSSIKELHQYWFKGGYPELWLEDNPHFSEAWYPQYFQTFVARDLRQSFPRIDAQRFRLFLQLLGGLSGEIINYSDVARHLGVSQPTARDYFHIAHHTFIWRTLWPYEHNAQKRIIKHPKGYIRDSGLLHYQIRIQDEAHLLAHPKMGNSWEGMVIEQLLRGLDARGVPYTPYHYRTKGGSEIDLILEGRFGIIPIEIKYASRIKKTALKALQTFCEDRQLPLGIIINNDDQVRWYSEKIVGIPLAFTI